MLPRLASRSSTSVCRHHHRAALAAVRPATSQRNVTTLPRHQSTDAYKHVPSAIGDFRHGSELSQGDQSDHEVPVGPVAPDQLESYKLDSNRPDPTGRAISYLVAGTSAFLYASVARVAVVKFLTTWSASADVLALSSLEVDLTNIAEGTSTTVKWRGKPVFVSHRSAKQIEQAHQDDKLVKSGGLRDPELDKDRTQDEHWMVVLGVCTHLGCVPIANSGDYNGWFCPCHGSHYDTSGRVRKGPAPLNLEVPGYKFLSPTKILIG